MVIAYRRSCFFFSYIIHTFQYCLCKIQQNRTDAQHDGHNEDGVEHGLEGREEGKDDLAHLKHHTTRERARGKTKRIIGSAMILN